MAAVLKRTPACSQLVRRALAAELFHETVVVGVGNRRQMTDDLLDLGLVEALGGSLGDGDDLTVEQAERGVREAARVQLEQALVERASRMPSAGGRGPATRRVPNTSLLLDAVDDRDEHGPRASAHHRVRRLRVRKS